MFRTSFILLVTLAACVGTTDSENTKSSARNNGKTPQQTKDGGTSIVTPGYDAGSDDPNVPEVPEDAGSGYVFKPYDINHIGVTGQSNSVALSAAPITFNSPYGNLMFDTGVMPMTNCDGAGCKTYDTPSSLVPLLEGDYFFWGSKAETLSAGFANEVSKLYPNHTSLVSIHGRSGNTYWCLRKGGCNYKQGYLVPFEQGMKEIADAKRLASQAGKSYIVRAILSVHGESDHYSYSANSQEFPINSSNGTYQAIKDYSDALIEWQADYEQEAKKITGQTEHVPFFISQVSGWNDVQESVVAQMQLDAHARSGGKVTLVTPGYPFPFLADCKHFTSHGQRQLGEYFAKAYKRVIVDGIKWEPVRPKSITTKGNALVIKYYVPVTPLVLDTDRITNPGNFGFRYTDDAGTTITSVMVTYHDTVTITLSQAPGNNARLTYAQNQTPNTCTGAVGARGNLRDSDKTPSQYGYELFNWGVSFIATL